MTDYYPADGVVRVSQLNPKQWVAVYSVQTPGDDDHVPCLFTRTATGKTKAKALKALFKDWELYCPVYEVKVS